MLRGHNRPSLETYRLVSGPGVMGVPDAQPLQLERSMWQRRVGCGEIGGFLQRTACQVLPLTGLGNGTQVPEVPFDMFQDWQEITHSIFREGPRGRDNKWM